MLVALTAFRALGQGKAPSAPAINKIDPPNWWSTLPDPMLLVYGQNLSNAHFAVAGRGVRIHRVQTSANGHYAFLWLTTRDAAPQKIVIKAANPAGVATDPYELKARKQAVDRYQGFNPSDVLYLIMTDRFADGNPGNDQPGYAPQAPRGWHGGDLSGIDRHIDYLQQLGVTTLWLTPVLSNGNMHDSYHGYAAVDLYAIDSHFGSLGDYQRLVDDLHARGMKIVFDIVPNHIGFEHPWIQDPPTPDWFHGTPENHTHVQGNFRSLIDPHATAAESFDITHGWFTDAMPDLNQENPLVSQYLIQNAIWWIETVGLDGLRIDTYPYVGRPFWRDFHQAIHSIYPNLTSVGEIWNLDPAITSFYAGGASHDGIDTGLYTPFDFPFYFSLRDVLLRGKPMTELATVLADDSLYPHPERLVTFFGNHDTMRFLSEPGASIAKLKLAFVLIATVRGTPEIYSGDEIAMQGKNDPDNRRDFPGGFPDSTHDAFKASGRTAEEQDLYIWVSSLLRVREGSSAIRSGQQQDLFADQTGMALLRGEELNQACSSGSLARTLIVLNDGDQPRPLDLATANTGLAGCAVFRPLFPANAPAADVENGHISVKMAPQSAAIYSVE